MGLSVKVGSFTLPSVLKGTVSVSIGFDPKVIFLWSTGRTETADAVGRATALASFGWGLGTALNNRLSVGFASADAAATSDTASRRLATACLVEINPPDAGLNGSLDVYEDFGTTANTAVFVASVAFAANKQAFYLALGGTDLTVQSGTFIEGRTTEVPANFQADAIMLISGSALTDGAISVGWATGPTAAENFCWAGASDDGNMTSNVSRRYCCSGESVALFEAANPPVTNARGYVSAISSTGFTMTWNETAATGRSVYWVALKGIQVAAGSLTTLTNATDNIDVTGLGCDPVAVMFMSACTSESAADTPATGLEMSIGATTGTAECRVASARDENGAGKSICSTAVGYEDGTDDEVYLNITSTAVEGAMDFVSFLTGGFRCKMSDADPSAAFVAYIAFGPAAVQGSTNTNQLMLVGSGT